MQNICGRLGRRLVSLCAHCLMGSLDLKREDPNVQDIIWIGIMLGLLAATLAYVRLCDNA